jgi:hypothetical protein
VGPGRHLIFVLRLAAGLPRKVATRLLALERRPRRRVAFHTVLRVRRRLKRPMFTESITERFLKWPRRGRTMFSRET